MSYNLKLRAVGEVCGDYRFESMMSSIDNNDVSCLSCANWDGQKCSIDVFDRVLTNLEQR